MLARGLTMLALVLTTSALASPARAGNDEGILLGNEAAMTGGAVGAIIGDGTGVWYNPAGIALVVRDQVDVSGSATMLRIGQAGAFFRTSSGAAASGDYFELLAVPSAVSLVRPIDCRTNFALGIFVPQLTDHTDRILLTETFPDGSGGARWQLSQHESTQQYYAGLALGFAITETFRLGITLFGFYRNYANTSHFFGAQHDATDTTIATYGLAEFASVQAVGLELAGGLQWEMVPGWLLGITIRSPGLQLGTSSRVTSTGLVADPSGIFFEPEDSTGLVPNVQFVSPARIRASIAHRFANGFVALEGDLAHPLDLPGDDLDRELLWNIRAGGRFWLDSRLALGFGLFTDLSPLRSDPQAYGLTHIDYFGGSAGIEILNPHTLGEGESASDLVFSSTIGLRYAVGTGHIGGLRFDATAASDSRVTVTQVHTTVHELALHIGSALYF